MTLTAPVTSGNRVTIASKKPIFGQFMASDQAKIQQAEALIPLLETATYEGVSLRRIFSVLAQSPKQTVWFEEVIPKLHQLYADKMQVQFKAQAPALKPAWSWDTLIPTKNMKNAEKNLRTELWLQVFDNIIKPAALDLERAQAINLHYNNGGAMIGYSLTDVGRSIQHRLEIE